MDISTKTEDDIKKEKLENGYVSVCFRYLGFTTQRQFANLRLAPMALLLEGKNK